jgi:hypothetical protein
LTHGYFLVLGCSQAKATDWKLYCVSDEALYFYEANSVTMSKGILRVSEKSVVRQIRQYDSPHARKETTELVNKSLGELDDEQRKKTVDVLALQVTGRLYEIRCKNKMYRLTIEMKYDREETLIDGVASSKWENTKPRSTIEILYNAVCR